MFFSLSLLFLFLFKFLFFTSWNLFLINRLIANEILDILFDPESSDSEFDDETIDVIFEPPKETA